MNISLGRTLAFVILGIVGPACAAGNQNGSAAAMAFRTLYTGDQGLPTARAEVIRTADDFSELWAEAHRRVSPPPSVPDVDFSQDVVAVIALGDRASGGHRVDVTGVREEGGETVITYQVATPGPGCMTISVMTTPTVFVAVEATDRPIRFEAVQVQTPC